MFLFFLFSFVTQRPEEYIYYPFCEIQRRSGGGVGVEPCGSGGGGVGSGSGGVGSGGGGGVGVGPAPGGSGVASGAADGPPGGGGGWRLLLRSMVTVTVKSVNMSADMEAHRAST